MILIGISRLATDQRRQVRTSAITCLQRALLVHDLQTLSGPEWSSCFKQVLFPLLNELLAEKSSTSDPPLVEESRMRASTIMSKVFLHHLTPLIGLPNFNDLWLEILDYLEKYMSVGSDMLYEAVLESLKNMLLVMYSVMYLYIIETIKITCFMIQIDKFQVRVFHNEDGLNYSSTWDVTWTRIDVFLPQLKDELFKTEVRQNQNKKAVEADVNHPQQSFGVHNQFSNIAGPPPTTSSISTISGPENTIKAAPPPKQLIQEGVAPVTQKNSIILQPPRNLLHQAATQFIVGHLIFIII